MITRKKTAVFTDDCPDTSNAICSYCKNEYDTIVKTVPYIMEDGREDKGFRSCPNCTRVIPKNLTRYTNIETEPLGSLSGKSPTYEVAVTKRRSRKNSTGLEPTEDQVPKLNNKPDTELESLLSEHNGILLSCVDDNVSEEQEY